MQAFRLTSFAGLIASLLPRGNRLHKGYPIQHPAKLLPRVPDTQAEIEARAAVAHGKRWNLGRRQHEKACVNVSKWRRALQREALASSNGVTARRDGHF